MTKLVNKYILITLALLLSASVFSQQHKNEFYISGSAGTSKLMYQLNTGKNIFQAGGALGFGYKRFFTETIGLSIGLEGALYNGGFKNSELTYKEKVYDHVFKDVDYTAVLSSYKEKHSAYTVNMPILLHFQTPGKHKYYAALGGKICLPVSLSSTQMPVNKIIAVGHADEYNTILDDIEIMGYGEFNKAEKVKHKSSDIDIKTKLSAILTGEIGMKWNLAEKTYLYTAAYIDYGITSISSLSPKAKTKDFLPHYGMSAIDSNNENAPILVNSVLNSRYDYNDKGGVNFTKNDKIRPLIVGIKLALSFGFGEKHGFSIPKASSLAVVAPVAVVATEAIKEVAPIVEEKPELVKEPIKEIVKEPIKEIYVEPKPIPVIKDENLADLTEKEKVKRPDEDIALVIDNYRINGANLSKYWTDIIDELILPLKDKLNYHFVLEGHTCDLGSDITNDRLSLERSEIVKKYLVDKGFAPERIKTVGKGEHLPLVPNTSHENRLKNRRVVFFITNTNK